MQKEGATIYDGPFGWTCTRPLSNAAKIAVRSYSMACSEKELGTPKSTKASIILDDDAPVGMPLADYMGDAVLDISIVPNMARNANVTHRT